MDLFVFPLLNVDVHLLFYSVTYINADGKRKPFILITQVDSWHILHAPLIATQEDKRNKKRNEMLQTKCDRENCYSYRRCSQPMQAF